MEEALEVDPKIASGSSFAGRLWCLSGDEGIFNRNFLGLGLNLVSLR
jgi:hypothetical protein